MSNEEIEQTVVGTDIETIRTYNKGAENYEEKYLAMGARVEDINRGLELCGVEKPFTIEIGPGNGREAAVLADKVGKYIGVEVSASFIELAKQKLPELDFVQSDIANYDFPDDVDLVLAFASLLHLPKESLKAVFRNIYKALKINGVLYVSLKKKDDYSDETITDENGSRHFYYYNLATLNELIPNGFEQVYYEEQVHGGEAWLTMALKKSE